MRNFNQRWTVKDFIGLVTELARGGLPVALVLLAFFGLAFVGGGLLAAGLITLGLPNLPACALGFAAGGGAFYAAVLALEDRGAI